MDIFELFLYGGRIDVFGNGIHYLAGVDEEYAGGDRVPKGWNYKYQVVEIFRVFHNLQTDKLL